MLSLRGSSLTRIAAIVPVADSSGIPIDGPGYRRQSGLPQDRLDWFRRHRVDQIRVSCPNSGNRDQLRKQKRTQRNAGSNEKNGTVIDDPDQTQQGRQDYCSNVIDGKADEDVAAMSSGLAIFWK